LARGGAALSRRGGAAGDRRRPDLSALISETAADRISARQRVKKLHPRSVCRSGMPVRAGPEPMRFVRLSFRKLSGEGF
jgi:hypothetical protein